MSAAFRNASIFETLTDPRYYQRPDSPAEREDELSFDANVDPSEHECNTCGWRGQAPSLPEYPWGSEERRYCPSCRKWTAAAEEWNVVSADPFEAVLGAGEVVGPFESPVPVRKPAAAEQSNLFQEVA